MATALNILSDEDIQRCRPADDEPGFGSLSTRRGHLPLRDMDVRAEITGLISKVELRQVFVNNLDEPLEATYIFPLPDRAAVTKFQLEVAGRIVDGIIKERGEARRDYDRAIAAGKRAAITEEDRPGVFTLRAGNIMPGEAATVRLTMTGPLPFDGGEATFRFPLVVAPRYIPGTALARSDVGDGVASDTNAVPDASRISPPVLLEGYPNPVRLSMEVALDPGHLPLSGIKSSLHAIMEQTEGRLRKVTLHPGERLNRDFILRFRLGEDALTTDALLCPDTSGDQGTVVVTLAPPANLLQSTKPRDVIFILDRSGSMDGWKMVAARRALGRMVDSLTERDRYGLVAFDHTSARPDHFGQRKLVDATNRERFRTLEFLAKIEARGGTEMAGPLTDAATQLSGGYADRDRSIVLVTDGQVGNEDQILRTLKPLLGGTRIFALGIDRAVNSAFLNRLAELSGGLADVVESEDRLDEVMDRMNQRIGTPVLTAVTLETNGFELDRATIAPRRIPDLFVGRPVTVLARYKGSASGTIKVRGALSNGDKWEKEMRATVSGNQALHSVWARARVRSLEDDFVVGRGNKAELRRTIIDTSTRFSVLCRFTAFIAVDHSEVVNPGGDRHKVTQAVETPEGWGMTRKPSRSQGKRRRMAPPPPPSPMPSSVPGAMPVAKQGMKAEAMMGGVNRGAGAGGGAYNVAASAGPELLSDPVYGAPADFGVADDGFDGLAEFDAGDYDEGEELAPEELQEEAKEIAAPRPAPAKTQKAPRRRDARPEPTPNLSSAMVQRVQDILRIAKSGSEVGTVLGRIYNELKRVLSDMRSTGAPSAAISSLQALLTRLEPVATGGENPRTELLNEAVSVLERWGGPVETSGDFWAEVPE